jgi:type I site-specific restriction endonuclease
MSTGVSIKKIDHLMLGSPVKSRIRLWQTIGRALRLYTGKINAYIYDISDDLRKKKKINHTFRHAKERALEYENEKIDFTIHEIDMTRYY